MARNRQPVKALNLSTDQVKAAAAAERQRKAESRKALKASKAAQGQSEPAAPLTDAELPPVAPVDHRPPTSNEAALLAEMAATGMTREEAAESMGIDPETCEVLDDNKPRYMGPMLALVEARKHYHKAPNGILCNGDNLATLCGHYERPVVVAALIRAMELPGNPYISLNPGQQSMNLRNKARHAIKNGLLTMAQVEAALAAVTEGK